MAFGEITKQIAKEALGNQMKSVMDSLRPPDASAIAESIAAKPPTPAHETNVAGVIIGQVQAMQKALKEDEELLVLCMAGPEPLRVLEFFLPSPEVVVLTGIDSAKTITRVIQAAHALQLVCKPVSVPAPQKPARIRFIVPPPRKE